MCNARSGTSTIGRADIQQCNMKYSPRLRKARGGGSGGGGGGRRKGKQKNND